MSRSVGIWMAMAAVAVGCSHAAAVQDDEVKHITEFRLSREDVVEVSVWKEPELSRTVPIRPDGKITLPLVGDVKAEGLTPQELTGMVGHPGAFPLRNTMGVLQALALAGGLAEFADRGSISVLRADGRRVEVAYDDLVTGRSKVTLGPGDTVVVP